MNAQQLFRRQVDIVVDTFEVSNLDCEFQIKKYLKGKEPNTCELRIYNLKPETRHALAQKETPTVKVKAGYINNLFLLFLGEMRFVYDQREGPDNVLVCTTSTSEKALKKARIALSFGPKVSSEVVLRALVRTLGVGSGNIEQAVASLKSRGVASLFARGGVISGNVARAITDFCDSGGLEWSIQDGSIQFTDLNKPLAGTAVFLSSDTGLIGTPKMDNKGRMECQALIQPGLTPGKLIAMNSDTIKGGFRIEQVDYVGQTRGNDWYANIIAKRY